MNWNERIPEGGAIAGTEEIPIEEYSNFMKSKRKGEYLRIVDLILSRFSIPKNAKILEVGSGPGWIGIWLAQKRPDIILVGLEPSADMRRIAAQNAKNEMVADRVSYVEGYVEDLNQFPKNSFDFIFSNDSLHHWVNPKAGLLEIERVCKRGGDLLIHDSRRDLNFGGKIILYVFGALTTGRMWKYWKSSIQASYTPSEITQFFKETNLENWHVSADLMDISISRNFPCS